MYGWAHSSVWIEWLPAEQLVEGSNPSGPVTILVHFSGFHKRDGEIKRVGKNRNEVENLDLWALCIYAMKTPMTSTRYMTRLAKFSTTVLNKMR